jgi:23S rRNA (uracil1939-C5)-methyltransferase
MIVELTIESLAAGGDGVARDPDGRVTFVPRTAVGDRVRAELVSSRKRFARAEVRELVVASPDRVEVACRHFDRCGGCHWLHVSPDAQGRAKQQILADALRHAVDAGLELRPLLTPVSPLGWRRRARLHWVRRQRARGVMLGFYQRGSRHIVDVDECPQLAPELQDALAVVRDQLSSSLTGTGELSMVVGHTGDVHIVLSGACRGGPGVLVGKGGIVGVRAGKRGWGAEDIEIEPGLRAAADQFAQASTAGNSALSKLVDEAARPREGKRVLELYAGSGNFTRVLRRGATRVVAVDFATGAPLDGVKWRRGDVADIVAALVEVGRPFDLAVLDPPRTGAADVLAGLVSLSPRRIVYVSCDPATLARDVGRLREDGYAPLWCQGVDVMPQTAHVEAVLVLEATSSSGSTA